MIKSLNSLTNKSIAFISGAAIILSGLFFTVIKTEADEPVAITTCTNITEPGVYELTVDILQDQDGTCIAIHASDVTLRSAGESKFTIKPSGVNPSAHTAILIDDGNQDNVLIQNIIVDSDGDDRFGFGIRSISGTNINISNVEVYNVAIIGISVANGSDNTVSSSIVSGVTTSGNNTGHGVYFENSLNSRVISSEVSDVSRYGIFFRGDVSGGEVNGNTISETSGDPIKFFPCQAGSQGDCEERISNIVISNNLLSNYEGGIDVSRSDNITITGNEINGEYDFDDWVGPDSEGVQIYDSTVVNISENNFNNVYNTGVYIGDSSGVEISDNSFENIAESAIEIGDSEDVLIESNSIAFVGLDDYDSIEVYDSSNIEIIGNTITDSVDADAIGVDYSSDINISQNTILRIYSDGIYIFESQNVTVTNNTINQVGADGIDFSDQGGDGSFNVTVTNNTLQNIGDNGIEMSRVTGGVISGNTMSVSYKGIDVTEVYDLSISNNTITPISSSGYQIESTSLSSIETDPGSATVAEHGTYYNDFDDYTLRSDDGYFFYDLPFTFPYLGRDIVSIVADGNGVVELLEAGEQGGCTVCGDRNNFRNYLNGNDIIFANYDDLLTDTSESDYMGVFNFEDHVVIEWYGSHISTNSNDNLLHAQVILYENGQIRWNMISTEFNEYYYELFTGAISAENDVYIAGTLINQPSSYLGDFSSNSNFTLEEGIVS